MKTYFIYILQVLSFKIQFDFFWKILENISGALVIVNKVSLFQMQNLKGKKSPLVTYMF